jgi:hypothetical protein
MSIPASIRLAGAALAFTAAAPLPAAAQVRTEPSAASLVNPQNAADARTLFERSGLFMIAGGVLPDGHAAFFLSQNGADQPVATGDVQLLAVPGGGAALRLAGNDYALAMPAGLACPLGEFVARDGVVAYTIPKYMDPGSRIAMLDAGLVHHRIAREFDNSPFVKLLKAADFGATTPLPPDVAEQITSGINKANGISGLVINASDDVDTMIGSYINSGMQVTYHVYLQPQTHSVEIGGVPLRYFWKMERDNSAGVFSVEIYAQNWAPGTHLTDLTAPNAQPSQYDVVNFYQVAALFRQLHLANPEGFTHFVSQACNKAV